MKTAYAKFTHFLTAYVSDVPLLIFRLVLGYNFIDPATRKFNNFGEIVSWFGDDLGMPFPTVMAFLATASEILAFILLPLGLGTRFIVVPLMVTMVVAITTVHWEGGYSEFEIPFLYLIMMFTLFVYGAGRISIDYWLDKWIYKKP
jgi:putative oxidoreductase